MKNLRLSGTVELANIARQSTALETEWPDEAMLLTVDWDNGRMEQRIETQDDGRVRATIVIIHADRQVKRLDLTLRGPDDGEPTCSSTA
jgi:hypothetical protein